LHVKKTKIMLCVYEKRLIERLRPTSYNSIYASTTPKHLYLD